MTWPRGHAHAEVGQHLAHAAHDPQVLDDDRIIHRFIRHVTKYATRAASRIKGHAAAGRR